MITSPRTARLVGAATLWLPLYFVGFLVFTVVMVVTRFAGMTPSSGLPTGLVVLFALHALTILLAIGLLVVYLVDVFHNPDLTDTSDKRVLWAVLIVMVGMGAMPAYWWIYLRPSSESFARRTSA